MRRLSSFQESARNRDGWWVGAGVEHFLSLPEAPFLTSPGLRGGYLYSYYDSRGKEYDYHSHGVWLGGAATLPFEVVFDAEAGFYYRPYRDPSTYPNSPVPAGRQYPLSSNNKREREWRVSTSLERAINEYLGISVYWRFSDVDSNVGVFDYDRHVVGVQLTGHLGP